MTNDVDLADSLINNILEGITPEQKTVLIAKGLGKVDSLLNGIRIVAQTPNVMSEEGQKRLLVAIADFRSESDAIAELEASRLIEKLLY